MVHGKLNWCLFSTNLLNVTPSGVSGSACWDTLKQGLHEPWTISPDREHDKDCWACVTCQAGHIQYLANSRCVHTICNLCCAMTARFWVSVIQFNFPSSPFMPISCPPIKNAPRWLVKGGWEWRLGLFKDPSKLFTAKFDSENGGGLISHAEVFQGVRVANVMFWRNQQKHGPNRNVCWRCGSTSLDSQSQHPVFKQLVLFIRCKREHLKLATAVQRIFVILKLLFKECG